MVFEGLRATTKKSSTFLAKKVHPQTKSWLRRLWKMPYLTVFEESSKNLQIRIQNGMTSKIVQICISGKNFHEDPFSMFYVKLLTDRQTDRQTNAW